MKLRALLVSAMDRILSEANPLVDLFFALAHHLITLVGILRDIGQYLFVDHSFYAEHEQDIVMPRLMIATTNRCNANCIFCGYGVTTDKKGLMSQELFQKVVDDYAAMGGGELWLTPTVGEPLLDPGLFDKISYAHDTGTFSEIAFFTNGLLLAHENRAERLIKSGITRIGISMAETDREQYQHLYRVKEYDQLMVGIEKLLTINRERGEPVNICFHFRSSMAPSQLFKTPDFNRVIRPFLSHQVSYAFMVDYDNWGGAVARDQLPGVMKVRYTPRVKKTPCRRTFEGIVLHDGGYRLCACRLLGSERDDLVVGEVTQNSLFSIWNSKNIRDVRQRFVNSDLPAVCRDCSFYEPVTRSFFANAPRATAGD